MSRRLVVSLDLLLLAGKAPQAPRLGPVFATHVDPPDKGAIGRWATIVGYDDRFLLLVDQFRARAPQTFELTLASARRLRPEGRRVRTRTGRESVTVHLLGDYEVEPQSGHVLLRQRLIQGRFLVALTHDPDARVRVAHGWAVEVCSDGRVFHVMHSNRSRKLRPLGPIQTDAPHGVAEWREMPDGLFPPAEQVTLHLLRATQVVCGEKKMHSDVPVDVRWNGE